ncbi:MAG: rRNA maturation RNase YbeY [Candidatus Latescibacteria bacterium]|nr:rRNA maturation RNase YbeY [Candidatus Latescibacterota bacterium]
MHILTSPSLSPLPADQESALQQLGQSVLAAHPVSGSIEIVCTDDAQIRRLNQTYRGKDRATDVLSFNLSDDYHACGEIYISLETARRQADSLAVPFDQELGRLLVHGLLHLAGYDHQTETELARMERLTDRFLQEAGLLPAATA